MRKGLFCSISLHCTVGTFSEAKDLVLTSFLAFFMHPESAWSPSPLRNSFRTLPMTLCSIVKWRAQLQAAHGVRQRSVFLWLVLLMDGFFSENIDRNFLITNSQCNIKMESAIIFGTFSSVNVTGRYLQITVGWSFALGVTSILTLLYATATDQASG